MRPRVPKEYQNVHLIDKDKPSAVHAAILDGARASGRNILVEQKYAEKTASGLIIPDSVKQSMAWVVLSVGPKASEACGLDLAYGSRVVFSGAQEMALGGRKFGFVDAGQILCVLDPETAAKFFDAVVLADIVGTA